MKIVYAREPVPSTLKRSIFLAGPTPRSAGVRSWRPEAISLLAELGYDGTVFVPENSESPPAFDYMDQVEWEEVGLHVADVIVFWIPRDLVTLPGFTTNVEWGFWCDSGKTVFGAPKQAPKTAYLQHYAKKFGVPVASTLRQTLSAALDLIGEGEQRTLGEREVPLSIWKQPSFQKWYRAQVDAGNRLDGARVLWRFSPTNSYDPFCWVMRPSMHIASEGRNKSGEFTVTRPDIASVVAYYRGTSVHDSSVVLVKEFRSCAATKDGMVHELPGGSSDDEFDPRLVASNELCEETGMSFPTDRFVLHATRQCMATILTHRSTVFSIELSKAELARFRSHEGQRFGENDSERTYVEVRTVREILESGDVDWAHIGMIMSVLREEPISRC